MVLSASQRAIIERARALGSGEQAVALSDEMCAYLVAVIVGDLGMTKKFPEFKGRVTPFFTAKPLRDLLIEGVAFMTVYERLDWVEQGCRHVLCLPRRVCTRVG